MSDVRELTDQDFYAVIKDLDVALVTFFAPWAGHYKRLAPELEVAATALKANDPPVPIIRVDCTDAGKDTCSRCGVSGYPTMKVFRNGEMSADYDGPRDSAGIIETMIKQSGPSSVELKDLAHLDALVAASRAPLTVFVGGEGDEARKAFLKAADRQRDSHRFAHGDLPGLGAHLGVSAPSLVVLNPYNGTPPSRAVMTSDFTEESIDDFVARETLPDVYDTVAEGQTYTADLFVGRTPSRLVFVGPPTSREAAVDALRAIGQAHRGEVLPFFVSSEDIRDRHLQDMMANFDGEACTWLFVGGSNYRRDGVPSAGELEAFIAAGHAGELEKHYRSAPVPETQDGPTYELVGSTFQSIAMSPERDVFVACYAPWDGHWKTMSPRWDELAESMAAHDEILIARIDGSRNETHPSCPVQGFPTIYFIPQSNQPLKYQGGREVSDFLAFLRQNATNPIPQTTSRRRKRRPGDEL